MLTPSGSQLFISKLKKHLLPRVYASLLQEAEQNPNDYSLQIQTLKALNYAADVELNQLDLDQLFFHSDTIYKHDIFHVNYTSYDVRRETDIINPKTSRQNIICLRQLEADDSPQTAHRFVYARILSIFHVNVYYRGKGSLDLRKRRFDFLWVRWFQAVQPTTSPDSLDRLSFLPARHPDAIGFLDPASVLRASHIIPRYSLGPVYDNTDEGRIFSKAAKEQEDWKEYYVNR